MKYRAITVYPLEYKTPIRVETVEDKEELWDLMDEVDQQFGKCIGIPESEWESFKNLITKTK